MCQINLRVLFPVPVFMPKAVLKKKKKRKKKISRGICHVKKSLKYILIHWCNKLSCKVQAFHKMTLISLVWNHVFEANKCWFPLPFLCLCLCSMCVTDCCNDSKEVTVSGVCWFGSVDLCLLFSTVMWAVSPLQLHGNHCYSPCLIKMSHPLLQYTAEFSAN